MKHRLFVLVLIVGFFTFGAVNADASVQENSSKNIVIISTGGSPDKFIGTFNITRFAARRGRIIMLGTLRGTVTKATPARGTNQTNMIPVAVQKVDRQVAVPVINMFGTCLILNLSLRPLDLNLQGLRVQFSQVNFEIFAEQGSGNLLSNLLCKIAKLLLRPSPVSGAMAIHLNQILDALG